MADFKLEAIFEFVNKGKREVYEAEKDIAGLEQAADEASKGIEGLERATKAAGVALLGFSAGGAALIRSSTMVAAKNEQLALTLQTVGKNAGYSEEELARYEEQTKDMGITTSKAREAMMMMAQAQIDLADSADLARLAQDAAVIAQKDSSATYRDLIQVVQTGNTEMARNMGLVVDWKQAYRDFAASAGTTVSALSEQEKVQARVNHVMQQGEAIAGSYEASMGAAAKRMGSLNRQWETAQENLGEAFLPAMTAAVDAAAAMLKAFNDLDPATQKAASGLLGVGTVVTGMAGTFLLAAPRILKTVDALKQLKTTALGIKAAGLAGVAAPITAGAVIGVGQIRVWKRFGQAVEIATTGMRDAQDAGEKLDVVWDMSTKTISTLQEEYGLTEDAVTGYEQQIASAVEQQHEQNRENEETIGLLQRLGLRTKDVVDATAYVGYTYLDAKEAAGGFNNELERSDSMMGIINAKMGDTADEVGRVTEGWSEYAGEMGIISAKTRTAGDAHAHLGATSRDAAEGVEEEASAAEKGIEANQRAAEALANHARAATELAMGLKDASNAQIAKRLIGMLDEDAMGGEAFREASEAIGLSFGLMDEESIALSRSLPQLQEALNSNIIPMENADKALAALIADAKDGTVDIGALFAEFGNAPPKVNEAKSSIEGAGGAITEAGSDAETSTRQIGDLTEGMGTIPEEVTVGGIDQIGSDASGARGEVDKLDGALRGLPEHVTTRITQINEYIDTYETRRNASGTRFFEGGRTLVGERGPEMVTLPRGARIDSWSTTSARQVRNDNRRYADTVIIQDRTAMAMYLRQKRDRMVSAAAGGV